MFAIPELPPLIPAKMLSDALAALGAYAEAPSEEDLARAQAAEGMVALTVRLANALYGSALAHVMSTEYTASAAGVPAAYRAAAWQAAGADAEGTAILLHYAAMRLAADLRFISERLPVDLGVMGAAAGAAEALKLLLLEVCTVRSMDDPRAENITTNLACAQDQLATAGERIATCSRRAATSLPRSPKRAASRYRRQRRVQPYPLIIRPVLPQVASGSGAVRAARR